MSAKITLPNPENVKNFPADPKAVMVSARGVIRVVIRRYFWDKEKKRGCEKREYLGYVVDNCFYSNDEYRRLFKRNGTKRLVVQPAVSDQNCTLEKMAALETKLAAEFPLYHEIAKHIGLVDDLTSVWGADRANAVLSIAYQ